MRRGELSSRGAPELWVLGDAVFGKPSGLVFKTYTVKPEVANWLWHIQSRWRLVLVWIGKKPRGKFIEDVFAYEVTYGTMAEARAALRANDNAEEIVVDNPDRVGEGSVLMTLNTARYVRRG